MLALCIMDISEAREIGKPKVRFFLKFQIHVVDNLIPTLIGSVTAGQCLAKVDHDKQFERPALDDIWSSNTESINIAREDLEQGLPSRTRRESPQ